MFRRSESSYYSPSFRKRRSRARRRLGFAIFALLLIAIIGAGLLLGSLTPTRGRNNIPQIANASTDKGVAVPATAQASIPAGSAAGVNFASLSPVAVSPQKWDWPMNIYSPAAFKRAWEYSDGPVQNGKVTRGWDYGPTPIVSFLEQYKDSPQGLRLVQYWDKGRQEISDPSKPADGQGYVTQGPIVREMLAGEIEIGNKVYMPLGPSKLPVVGDLQDNNPALTYTNLGAVASTKNNNRAEKQLESTVTMTLDKQNRPVKDATLARYQVKQAYYSAELGHNIPNVFWDFLNRNGMVYQDGKYVTGRLYDWPNVAGLPLTEAYWTKALINGKTLDVLVQAFERRILVYNPLNPAGLQVEWANAGQHYLRWRYPSSVASPVAAQTAKNPPTTPTSTVQSSPVDTLETRLVIGNENLARAFEIKNGKVTRSSLTNRLTGHTYTSIEGLGVGGGFMLKLDGPDGASEAINGEQFTVVGYNLPVWNESEKQISLSVITGFKGQVLNLKLYWRAFSGRNYIEKWATIDPNPALAGWRIRFAAVEDLPLTEELKAAPATPDEESLPILIPTQKNNNVAGGAVFTHVMVHENQSEGLYFFSATPLGGEYALNKRMVMFQEEYQDLKDGFTSGKAVIGSYTGPVDIGFKRYTAYLENNYSQMAGKKQGVWYHSWYPFTNEINQDILMGQLDVMKSMGMYDILHIDAGWESTMPLEIDTKKFPQGFKTLYDKANDNNIRLGIWINPFSNSYEQYVSYAGMHQAHPEWHIKGMERIDPKKGYATGPFSILSDYYYYVKDKLVNLVKTYNIRAIYWDGADWNIPDANAPGLTEEQRNLIRVQGLKRMMALMDELHKVSSDIIVVGWNSTADVHLLGSIEQLQLSDVWELPLGESELFRQQEFYAATYHLPYYSLWGDWYAISYKENKDDNLKQPIDLLKYVETEMVGTGGNIAGGSLDLTKAPPELLNHIKKLYTWRRKFENYFRVYQHILNEPERGVDQVTGEAHIVDGAGFILLNNATDKPLEVNLPLSGPELELNPSKTYRLYDWSNLENGVLLGEASPGEGVLLTIPPRSVKIIGINIAGPLPASSQGS